MQAREERMRQQASEKKRDFKPLTLRLGFCGCCGERREARAYLEERIALTEEAIDRERQWVFENAIPTSFFVIFETQARYRAIPGPAAVVLEAGSAAPCLCMPVDLVPRPGPSAAAHWHA